MILHSGLRLVDMADEVVRTIEPFSNPAGSSPEAGGILLGSYKGPHVEVVDCTTPLPRNRRLWNLFDRKDPGHREEAIRRWKDSGRTVTFVGAWHTHPEPTPSPSFADRSTWRGIARRHKVGPLVVVIRGFSGWWFGRLREGSLTSLSPLGSQGGDSARPKSASLS
jgi:integrative and conjugative element protein (TIGR02256 family)